MNLKRLLDTHGITQTELARLLNRDKSVVTNLLQGKRQLKADEATLIAQRVNIPIGELLGMESAAAGVSESCLIPFQCEPARTRASKQVVQKEGKFYLEETGYYSNKAYALEARDDSLNLAGILAGDIIIAELDSPCRAGQIVVAQHYDDNGSAETLLRKYAPPFLLPHSTDPSFAPLSLENDNIRVVSPVIKLIRLL